MTTSLSCILWTAWVRHSLSSLRPGRYRRPDHELCARGLRRRGQRRCGQAIDTRLKLSAPFAHVAAVEHSAVGGRSVGVLFVSRHVLQRLEQLGQLRKVCMLRWKQSKYRKTIGN